MRSTPSEARTQLQQDDKATHKPVNHKQERGVVCGVNAVESPAKQERGRAPDVSEGLKFLNVNSQRAGGPASGILK